jgi:hypothetical protein
MQSTELVKHPHQILTPVTGPDDRNVSLHFRLLPIETPTLPATLDRDVEMLPVLFRLILTVVAPETGTWPNALALPNDRSVDLVSDRFDPPVDPAPPDM